MMSVKSSIVSFSKILVRHGKSIRILPRYIIRENGKLQYTGSQRTYSTGKVSQDNILLMGSPGCGKTTVGRILSSKLGLPVVDVDDHFLEPYWNMTVSEKLSMVGSAGFVQAEGEALFNFEPKGSVVSLTGSNPMYTKSFDKLAETGTVVFLDVHKDDILERLERMKVNRIVGQNGDTSMSNILTYRQQFYERAYDIRVICERNESPESMANKVMDHLQRKDAYESTRGFYKHDMDQGPYTFNEVVAEGLAPDGGLFVPSSRFPEFTKGELLRLVDLSYTERAVRVLERLIDRGSASPSKLKSFIQKAYPSDIFGSDPYPVVPLDNSTGQFLLELFHGPTASFKDAGLQLMPQLFMNALEGIGDTRRYLIAVATSGDTGGAVIDGFCRHAASSDIGVLVLYPEGGITDIQRHQMAALASRNTRVLGVSGANFDTCQRAVKRLFNDACLDKRLAKINVKLSAANSISWGRLVPQIAYHVSGYLDMVRTGVIQAGDAMDMCVPTGNFGNILAAYYAKKMGVPFERLICASNSNNVLTDFINNGVYDIADRPLKLTASPAIDILVSSNLERLIYDVTDRDGHVVNKCYDALQRTGKFAVPEMVFEKIKSVFQSDWCSEKDCIETVKKTLDSSGYLLDPHTAVAKAVADRHPGDRPLMIASTAHYGKFAETIYEAVGGGNYQGHDSSSVVDQLGRIASRPGPHTFLNGSLKKEIPKLEVCRSSYDEICAQVEDMAIMIGDSTSN